MRTQDEVMYILWKSRRWTQKEIADLFGCDIATVCRRIEPERWQRGEIVISAPKLRELYEQQHKTVSEVSEIFLCSERTVRRKLRKYNIPIRKQGKQAKKVSMPV